MKRILLALMLMPIAAFAAETLYMVIDLSGGTSAKNFPVSYCIFKREMGKIQIVLGKESVLKEIGDMKSPLERIA